MCLRGNVCKEKHAIPFHPLSILPFSPSNAPLMSIRNLYIHIYISVWMENLMKSKFAPRTMTNDFILESWKQVERIKIDNQIKIENGRNQRNHWNKQSKHNCK